MSDSSICIYLKIVDCGGGKTGILGGRTGILRGIEKVYSQKYSNGEQRTAVDDFEEFLN